MVDRADPADSVAVQIGIDLYDKHGDQGISEADLDTAIRAAIPKWESFPGQGVVKRAR